MSSSVASSQMDAMEAVAQLKGARQLGEALSQSARQQGAQSLASHDAQQALQHHTDQMDPQAQGRYEGSVGGQEAKKAQGGRALADPVERFAKPLLHLDTPASNITLTAGHSQIEIKGGNITFTCPGTWQLRNRL